jgi:hypothetical protein
MQLKKMSCYRYIWDMMFVNTFLKIKHAILLFYFMFLPCILILPRHLFIQLNAQPDCSRKMLKLALKFTLKCCYMFRLNKPSSGSLLLCFAKVIIIKIVS